MKNNRQLYAIYGILKSVKIKRTPEFIEWYENQTTKDQAHIDARMERVEEYQHVGDIKNLGDGIAEFRWPNGRRVYFAKFTQADGTIILLLIGGLKNAQKKDIKKAKLLIRKYEIT